MKLKIIACEVFFREICYCSYNSKNIIDTEFVQQGLHNFPDQLRKDLQSKIDLTPANKYDAILVGYGLCSNGIENVKATHTRLIVPRAHDCLTLFLGSKERYSTEFSDNSGTYWYTSGWIERTVMPGKARVDLDKQKFEEYKEKYGEDNALFLIEQEVQWYNNYSRALFVNMNLGDTDYYREKTLESANFLNWEYKEIEGNLNLIQKFVNGDWNEEDFQIIEVGKTIKSSYDNKIIRSV